MALNMDVRLNEKYMVVVRRRRRRQRRSVAWFGGVACKMERQSLELLYLGIEKYIYLTCLYIAYTHINGGGFAKFRYVEAVNRTRAKRTSE